MTAIPPNEDNPISVDTDLLEQIVRRQFLPWIFAGPILLIAIAGYWLFRVPQSFTAKASVAIQQPSMGAGSALAALAGQTPSRKHLGILHSRRMATDVEASAHMRTFYDLPTDKAAVDLLSGALKAEDSPTDGLLVISVNLPGPARMARVRPEERDRIKLKAAEVANTYVTALRRYYVQNDNERDSVLLRGAEEQLARARLDFRNSTNQLNQYLSSLRRVPPRANPATNALVPNGQSDLGSLYTSLSQVEADLPAAEAAEAAERAGRASQLSRPMDLPPEDPLLTEKRDAYDKARIELQELRIQLADDNPKVRSARERVRIARMNLDRQIAGVKRSKSSAQIQSLAKLQSLRAKRDSLEGQVASAERRLRTMGALSIPYERCKRDVEMKLEVLKTTLTETAKLKLSTVSAQSRISQVDDAIPPDSGQPGLFKICLVSAGAALGVLFLWLIAAYALAVRHQNSRLAAAGRVARGL